METVEHVSSTLATLEDLRSIVRTMKALAAASIRQYERAVESLSQYSQTVELGLRIVLRDMPAPPKRIHRSRAPLGLIVFGSDHGLCGRFNEDLADFLHAQLPDHRSNRASRAVVVGARMADLLHEADVEVADTIAGPGSAARITAVVDRLLVTLDAWEAEGTTGTVHVSYNRRRAGSGLRPMAQRVLPIDFHRFHRLKDQPWPSRVLPIFTMNREALFGALVRQYLFVTLFRACAESQAAEHASRLSAMQSASKNLDDRQGDLVGELRRRRQEMITSELLDVISGYEALSTV